MIAANAIGWLICFGWNNIFFKITFLVLTVSSVILSICLLAAFPNTEQFQLRDKERNATISIGVVTLVMNLALSMIAALLIFWQPVDAGMVPSSSSGTSDAGPRPDASPETGTVGPPQSVAY